MNPLLSVITPVYNVSLYLERCVESILNQSYHNIELILIDDGSTDHSSELCDEWAGKDSRIVVTHKDNGGVSSARNVGLEQARGEYITFVDSDDFLAPDTYEDNMDFLLKHQDVDILQYPYCDYINDNNISNFHKPSTDLLVGSEEIFRNWWSGKPLEYVIWNKIFKRKLWDDIRFCIGCTSEDTILVPEFVKKAKSVFISDKGLYYYQRAREDSYTYEYNFDKHLDLFYAHSAIYECFRLFPNMMTEKVLAFTRLYRRLITAKQADLHADIKEPLKIINRDFPSWREIIMSKHTEKLWLSIAKLLGEKLFVYIFLRYLK
jgi:glycosyltransferase involved in cell wall biosynthesis